MIKLFLCSHYKKPEIIIECNRELDFNPNRLKWVLSIYNEKLTGKKGYFCRRDELRCWVEIDFVYLVDDNMPVTFITNAYEPKFFLILKPDSNSYSLELVSKILGEGSFCIDKPSYGKKKDWESALVFIQVKTGNDEIIAKAIYAIFNEGNQAENFELIRLE